MVTVSYQVTSDVEQESAPGQQHQRYPTPRTCPGSHGLPEPGDSHCARPRQTHTRSNALLPVTTLATAPMPALAFFVEDAVW